MRTWIVLIFFTSPVFATFAAEEDADLRRRIQQLEQQTKALQKSHDSLLESMKRSLKEGELAQDSVVELEEQLHSNLQASGYADVEFRNSSAEGSHPSFRIHHFSLILTKQLDEHWRTFAEVEYEDAPRVEFVSGSPDCQGECGGQIFLEAMNIDYSPSDAFGIQVGRFFTPAGIWSIEPYPPFVVTQERPLHVRQIFPQLVDGALLHGTVPINDMFLNYDVYVGNGEGSSANSDNNDEKSVGMRAAIQLPWLTLFELGTSFYTDTLSGSGPPETTKVSTGFHAKIRNGSVLLQTEIASARYEPRDAAAYTTAGYYVQLGVDFSAVTVGYRNDFFEEYDAGSATKRDANRNSLFANYRVQKNIVLKFEHHLTARDGQDDENSSVASVAIYLGK